MLSSTCIDDCIYLLFVYVVTVVYVLYLRTALFWVVTKQVWVIYYYVSGQTVGPIVKEEFFEDGIDRLSRNVGKK
jgi:hypothetical protein